MKRIVYIELRKQETTESSEVETKICRDYPGFTETIEKD